MNSQASQSPNVKVVKEKKARKSVKINVANGSVTKIEEAETNPDSEMMETKIDGVDSKNDGVEIEKKAEVDSKNDGVEIEKKAEIDSKNDGVEIEMKAEVVVEEETEEEREMREEEERLAIEMAKAQAKRAMLKAKKDIIPQREMKVKELERQREIDEANVDRLKREADEAMARYVEAKNRLESYDERIEAVNRGECDAELLEKIGAQTEIVAKKQMTNMTKKIEVVAERGRGREREREIRAKSPMRQRAKSPARERSESPSRAMRKMPKLEDIIRQPTRFKYRVSSVDKYFEAEATRGDRIYFDLDGRGNSEKQLSNWIDRLEKHYNNGVNRRKLSVFDKARESVLYYNTRLAEWRRIALDYDENTTDFNLP